MIYKGLMIGGPMDGKMLTHSSERWDYHKAPESLTGPIDYSDMTATQAAMKATSETGSYYYTDMSVLGPARIGRLGFWVEYDKNIDDALEAILARYQEPRKDRDLLKRARRLMFNLLRQAMGIGETEFREARDLLQEMEEVTDEG